MAPRGRLDLCSGVLKPYGRAVVNTRKLGGSVAWWARAAGPLLERLAEDGERIAVGQFRQGATDFTRIPHENLEAPLYCGQTRGPLELRGFVFGHYTFPAAPHGKHN
jgi:hypothetical protein